MVADFAILRCELRKVLLKGGEMRMRFMRKRCAGLTYACPFCHRPFISEEEKRWHVISDHPDEARKLGLI